MAMAARLSERTRDRPDQVTHVFLTNFQPDHRRALELFEEAQWLMNEPEQEAAAIVLRERVEEAERGGDAELAAMFQHDMQLLRRIETAPDRIAPGVDLFPLPGVTPGNCGLLLPLPGRTVLLAGDAVATVEHLEQGKVLPDCTDLELAQESFREAIEIADVLVLGRGNIVLNPLRATMQ
jgi:glyoxylase-like metal-dependent hydrolase (beta-lactamase superfamily II)